MRYLRYLLALVALVGAFAFSTTLGGGTSRTEVAPYRSGKPAVQQIAPAGTYADVLCPQATGAANAADPAQAHAPFICGAGA